MDRDYPTVSSGIPKGLEFTNDLHKCGLNEWGPIFTPRLILETSGGENVNFMFSFIFTTVGKPIRMNYKYKDF